MIFVHQIMTPSPLVLARTAAVGEAVKLLLARRVHGAPVVDGSGRLVGIVSLVDLADARRTSLDGCATVVEDFMTRAPFTIDPGATAFDAAEQMVRRAAHRLVVVDDSFRPIGIVSPMDLLRATVNLGSGFRTRREEREDYVP